MGCHRTLVADEFAVKVGEDRREADQARAVLLAAARGRRSDAEAVRGDGAKDSPVAGGDRLEAGCWYQVRGEGRRGTESSTQKSLGICGLSFGRFGAPRKVIALLGRATRGEKNCTLQDQTMADRSTLNCGADQNGNPGWSVKWAGGSHAQATWCPGSLYHLSNFLRRHIC